MAKAWRLVAALRRIGALAAFCIVIAGEAAAIDTGPRVTDPWRDWTTGAAIGGYDPVAYYVHHAPRLGERRHEITIAGVTWWFSSPANRAVFARDPKVYTPRYGGRDPIQLARGFAVPGNPIEWVLEDDRLYLFVSPENRAQWLRSTPMDRAAAEANWPGVVAATQ